MAVIPNSNVNLATNIRDVLNAAGGNATNDVITFFNKENINPYSLEKPMSVKGVSGLSNTIIELTEEDKRKCNYGYSMPSNATLIDLTSYVRNGVVPNTWQNSDLGFGWFYNPPTGGSTDPYRLADFKGYDSLQKTAFTFTLDGINEVNEKDNTFTVAGKFPFSKFSYFDNMYVGVLFCKVGTTYSRGWFYVTNTKISTANGADIHLDEEYSTALFKTNGGGSGTWKICPFLCSDSNVQSIITSKSNYINDVSNLRVIPAGIITATYKSATVDAQAPYRNIKFVYIVTSVTSSKITIELYADNTSTAQTLNLQNMQYEVTMESQNIDDGQYVEIHSGTPLSSYFDTLTVKAGTSSSPTRTLLNDNMSISWTPRDGTDAMITPFYIDISFGSFTTANGQTYTHNFGSCRILYDDNGYWEQVY